MTCGLATALEPPHFNHAPVRGAIGASFSRRSRAGSFNPRTRVGCDPLLLRTLPVEAGFNPRTRVGCDRMEAFATSMDSAFQSTHPRGVRPRLRQQARRWRKFQSTHPRGVRHLDGERILLRALVSIHAPAWGATKSAYATTTPPPVSIHAPAWGATVSMFYPVDSRD